MPHKLVRVLIGEKGLPVKIFRDKSWLNYSEDEIGWMSKAEAVGLIRKQIFERVKNPLSGQFECAKCGKIITEQSGEMNEKRPKGAGGGKTGGEVSLENCEALCHQCHQGSPDSAHGNRRWQTAKLSPKGQND